jgi:hypothetical protein
MRIVNLFHDRLPYVRLVRRQIGFNVRTQIEKHKGCYYIVLLSNAGYRNRRYQQDCQKAFSSFNLNLSQIYVYVYQPRNANPGRLCYSVQK